MYDTALIIDIRESSLFCIRNLIVGCERNASFIADMEVRGLAPNPVLKELGFEAELDQKRNKIKIQNLKI
jgi:Spinocerebellar ataxia type 10 protein domain